jgi:two-component system sensor histidine kinase DesK
MKKGFLPGFVSMEGRPSARARIGYSSFWLLYLIFPLMETLNSGGWKAFLSVAALVTFVVLYVATVWAVTPWEEDVLLPRNAVLLGLFAVLTIVCVLAFGTAWSGLFIYLTSLTAMSLPWAWVPRGIVTIFLLALVTTVVLRADVAAVLTITVSILGVGLLMIGFRHSRMLNFRLRQANEKIGKLAATEERLRIARDLHDLLGHSLSLIVLKAEVAQRLGERDPDRVLREVEDIQSVARQALADVREAISGYRQRDLGEELDNARRALDSAGVTLDSSIRGTPLPDIVDGLFGWAVREGVTNIIRHSRATGCEIAIHRIGAMAELQIRDDGQADDFGAPGNGLTGLRERIEAAGGSLESGPMPGGGFRLVVRVPLNQVPQATPVESAQ